MGMARNLVLRMRMGMAGRRCYWWGGRWGKGVVGTVLVGCIASYQAHWPAACIPVYTARHQSHFPVFFILLGHASRRLPSSGMRCTTGCPISLLARFILHSLHCLPSSCMVCTAGLKGGMPAPFFLHSMLCWLPSGFAYCISLQGLHSHVLGSQQLHLHLLLHFDMNFNFWLKRNVHSVLVVCLPHLACIHTCFGTDGGHAAC